MSNNTTEQKKGFAKFRENLGRIFGNRLPKNFSMRSKPNGDISAVKKSDNNKKK